jgi:hypothetical protein
MKESVAVVLAAFSLSTSSLTPLQAASSSTKLNIALGKLPALSTQVPVESVVPQATPQVANAEDEKLARVNTAIGKFQKEILALYELNGKEKTSVADLLDGFSSALSSFCQSLEPDFDTKDFLEGDIKKQIKSAQGILNRDGIILGNFDISASLLTGRKATLSLSLERVVDQAELNCELFAFELIAATKNPFKSNVDLLETRIIIHESQDSSALAPISKLISDPIKGQYALLFGRHNMDDYLPNSFKEDASQLTPDLIIFLSNWGLGGLAYDLSQDQKTSTLPKVVEMNGGSVSLKNSVAIRYALEQEVVSNPDVAALIFNYLAVNADKSACAHAAHASAVATGLLAEKYPGIADLNNTTQGEAFFNSNPEIAKVYLEIFKSLLELELKRIKVEAEHEQVYENTKSRA